MAAPQRKKLARLWDVRMGLQLKAWRERQQPELTQDAIAVVMGVSRWSISRIENGHRPLKFEEVVRLLQEYHVTIHDVFGLPDLLLTLPPWLAVLPVLTPEERAEVHTLLQRVLHVLATALARWRRT